LVLGRDLKSIDACFVGLGGEAIKGLWINRRAYCWAICKFLRLLMLELEVIIRNNGVRLKLGVVFLYFVASGA